MCSFPQATRPTRRIYLDNAATSWPKPEEVYQAVDHYQRQLGAPAGRSGYAEALEVSHAVETARAGLARLLGATDARQIIFTSGGTDSLNLALHGLLRAGQHVVTTAFEHNSVLRPLRTLEDAGFITVDRVQCSPEGALDPRDLESAVARRRTHLVVITHASNVTGAIQPIEQAAAIAHRAGALVLVDAAQTAGHLPIAVDQFEIDLLAAPGHKGLLGPLGTGVLYVQPGLEKQLNAIRQGGTGTSSELDEQPQTLPHKYESGSLNVPGIMGLGAAVEYLLERGVPHVCQHERALMDRLRSQLAEIRGVRLYGPRDPDARVGVLSVTVDGYDPQEIAMVLDEVYRIQVRAGLHCAARAHATLATAPAGTVRFSVGAFNSEAEIDDAATAMQAIASSTLAAPRDAR